ncbi:MAG: hypothetical protein U0744_10540 [Gemmataceae bacterium]
MSPALIDCVFRAASKHASSPPKTAGPVMLFLAAALRDLRHGTFRSEVSPEMTMCPRVERLSPARLR